MINEHFVDQYTLGREISEYDAYRDARFLKVMTASGSKYEVNTGTLNFGSIGKNM